MENVLGKRIKELREKEGLSQEKMAEILGVKRQSILNYENCTRYPDCSVLMKYAEYFNVSTDWLLGIDTKLNYLAAFKTVIELVKNGYFILKESIKDEADYTDDDWFEKQEYEKEIFYPYERKFKITEESLCCISPELQLRLRKWREVYVLYDNGTISRELLKTWEKELLNDLKEFQASIDKQQRNDTLF